MDYIRIKFLSKTSPKVQNRAIVIDKIIHLRYTKINFEWRLAHATTN